MIDTDFERRANLLTNDGYFSRHRELVPEYGVQGAWQKLESELPFGITRYGSFHAFEAAKRKEAEGTLNKTVFLRV